MSGFEDFLSAQSSTPAAGALIQPPETPVDAMTAPDDFGKFLAKVKGDQDTSTVQAAQATAVANAHSGISADQAGQAAKTGRQLGIPQSAVETDPQAFQVQAKANANAAVMASNPVLAKWVAANPDSARIAQDEYDKLGSVEKMWQETKNAGYGAIQALGGAYNSSALAMNRAIAPNALAPWLFQSQDAQAWWQQNMIAPREAAAKTFEEKTPGVGAAVGQFAGSFAGMMSQVMTSGPEGAGAVEAGAGMLGTIANAAQNAVRAMWLPSATAAVNTGHDVMAAGGDAGQALAASAGAYAFSTLQGAVPFSAPGGVVSRAVSGFASGVATSEGQRAAMNLLLPASMHKDFDIQEALSQGAQSALLGAFLGPRKDVNYADAIRQTYVDAVKAETAQRDIAKVAALGQISAESKLRDANPDAFHDFVSQVTDKTELDAVYVNGAKLNEAFAQSKIDPIKSIADQMPEALSTGGDVRIPIADYATHIAGTDLEKAILPEMKATPDGMTYKEGQKFYQDAAKQMSDRAKKMADERQARVETDQDKAQVQQTMYDQMVAAGREPSVARTESILASEFYSAMGEREGMKASEMYQQSPVRFSAAEAASPSIRTPETQAVIDMRKRASILDSIKGCMA